MALIARDMGVNMTTAYEIIAEGVQGATELQSQLTVNVLINTTLWSTVAAVLIVLWAIKDGERTLDGICIIFMGIFILAWLIGFISLGLYYSAYIYPGLEMAQLPEFYALKQVAMKYGITGI